MVPRIAALLQTMGPGKIKMVITIPDLPIIVLLLWFGGAGFERVTATGAGTKLRFRGACICFRRSFGDRPCRIFHSWAFGCHANRPAAGAWG